MNRVLSAPAWYRGEGDLPATNLPLTARRNKKAQHRLGLMSLIYKEKFWSG